MKKRLPKGQTKLFPEFEAISELKEELGLILNEEVICPFCGYRSRAIEFRVKKSSKSSKYSTKKFKCPDCGQVMKRSTLLRDMTVSDWARWLYYDVIRASRGKGFHRISFDKLSQRLKEYGWAKEFWEAWKAAKEGRDRSDIEDYLDYLRSASSEMRSKCEKLKSGLTGRNSITCITCENYNFCWPEELREWE